MKVYIDATTITKVAEEKEYPVLSGNNYVDSITVYYNGNPSSLGFYPTLNILKPNDRKVTSIQYDSDAVYPLTETDSDNVTWYYYKFTLSSVGNLIDIVGQYQITITTNFVNSDTGAITGQRGINVLLNVLNATMNDDQDILILGDDGSTVIASLYSLLQTLQSTVNTLGNSVVALSQSVTTQALTASNSFTSNGTSEFNGESTFYDDIAVNSADIVQTNGGYSTNGNVEANSFSIGGVDLNNYIDNLTSQLLVSEVVATYAALQAVDTTDLNSGVRYAVMSDTNYNDNPTIYAWDGSSWVYKGTFEWSDYLDSKFATLEDTVTDRLDAQDASIASLASATPEIFDTAANITALTANGGVAVATDTGYVYVWDSTNSIYKDTGVLYVQDTSQLYSLYNATEVANGTNLNSMISVGNYVMSAAVASSCSNCPTTNGCVLKIERISYGSGFYRQTIIDNANDWYVRHYYAGSWSSWKSPAYKSELALYPYSLANATIITAANEDLNNYTTFGTYVAGAAAKDTMLNFPSFIPTGQGGGIVLKVERSSYATSPYMMQTIIYGNAIIGIRFNTGSWGAWKKLAFVADIEDAINDLKSDLNLLESYWDTEIDTSVTSVETNALNIASGDTILFVTDTHYNNSSGKSPLVINSLAKKLGINLCLNGGDVLTTYKNSKIGAVNEMNNFFKKFDIGINLISTIGNHDTNGTLAGASDDTYKLTDSQLYNVMFKRCEKFFNTNNSYRCYYDNESQKIRYITFDYYDIDSAISNDAKTFITNACNGLSSDWNIVLLTHSYWYPSLGGVPTPSTYSTQMAVFLADLKEAISANIICLLVGHCHKDVSATVNSTSGNTTLLILGFQTDAYNISSLWGGETMTQGTATENAVSIIQFDTTNNKIYVTRCGAGNDSTYNY